MASTYNDLKIQLMATGDNNNTWGEVTNVNFNAFQQAITGSDDVVFASANVVLTLVDSNAPQAARALRLRLTGVTGGATRTLEVPQIEKQYLVFNGCTDPITVKTALAGGVTVPAGKTMVLFNDGVNVNEAMSYSSNLTIETLSAKLANGTALAPSLSFTSDGSTGLFMPAVGQLGITTNSAERLRVGNGAVSAVAGVVFNAYEADLVRQNFLQIGADGAGSFLEATFMAGGSADMRFRNAGVEHMRITGVGRVGIGVPNPSALLHVYSTTDARTRLQNNARVYDTALIGTAWTLTEVDVAERLRIDGANLTFNGGMTASGEVVAKPNYRALSNGAVDPFYGFYNDDGSFRRGFITQTPTYMAFVNDVAGGGYAFAAGGDNRFAMNSTGQANIGTSVLSFDSVLRVDGGLLGAMRLYYNGLSQNYYDCAVHSFRSANGTVPMLVIDAPLGKTTATGNLVISGNANFGAALVDTGQLYHQTALGLVVAGAGSTHDLVLANKGGNSVLQIPTGTTIIDLPGGQLKFPAVQQNSSNPNTLDDYEEGTWVPALMINGSSAGIVHVTQSAQYTKIGNKVTINGVISISSKGVGVGHVQIAGQPWANGGNHSMIDLACDALTTPLVPKMLVLQGSSTLALYYQTNNLNALQATEIGNTFVVYFNGTFMTP